MTGSDPLQLLHQARAHAKIEAATPECLDDGTLGALAEGSLEAPARAEALRHLAGCRRCQGVVAAVARAINDPAVQRELATGGRRRLIWAAIPAAAAAVLLLVVAWPRGSNEGGGGHRGGGSTIEGAAAPLPLSPTGTVANARSLTWTAVTGADRYRIALSDVQGRTVFETELPDTIAALPDSVVLTVGVTYLWTVDARIGWNRWATSPVARFTIVPGAGP